MSTVHTQKTANGFAFVTALFLLLILAAFAAFAVNIMANASATAVLAVQGVRGWEAARAGLNWGSYQIMREPSGGTYGTVNLPDCFATPTALTLPAAFGDFQVSVTCQRFPAIGDSPNVHEDGRTRVAQFVLVATASSGTLGAADYVERKLEARIEKCKDPDGSGPLYTCP